MDCDCKEDIASAESCPESCLARGLDEVSNSNVSSAGSSTPSSLLVDSEVTVVFDYTPFIPEDEDVDDDDEKKLLEVLKGMDVDKDGEIGLVELCTMGCARFTALRKSGHWQ